MKTIQQNLSLAVLEPKQALLLEDFHFFTRNCPSRKHLRVAISQINKQYYSGKLKEEVVYKACTSGKDLFYKIEELNGQNIIIIDDVYQLQNGIPTQIN